MKFSLCSGLRRLADPRGDDPRYQPGITAYIQQSAYRAVVVPDEVQVRPVHADDPITRREAAFVTTDQAIEHAYCRSVACCQNHFVERLGAAIRKKGSVVSKALNARPDCY